MEHPGKGDWQCVHTSHLITTHTPNTAHMHPPTHQPTPHPLSTHIVWYTGYVLVDYNSNQPSPCRPHQEAGHKETTGHH